MLIVWIQFLSCVAVIWIAGVRLSRYGDVIAEKARLSRTWIGLILLAAVTYLPELVTGISAVALANSPDIALGDALGSCVFNLLIVTVLDFLQRGESVFTRASQGHILSGGFGVILIGFVGFTILLGSHGPMPAVGQRRRVQSDHLRDVRDRPAQRVPLRAAAAGRVRRGGGRAIR